MAQTNDGILGVFTGTAGPVTGFIRNGRNIIRTSRSIVQYKYTALRKPQLKKISICNAFTKAFSGTGFFRNTFEADGSGGNGYNRAMSALMNKAVTGIYPALQLSYPDVLVSKGRLPGAAFPAAVAMSDGNIYFHFTNNSDTGTASENDRIILVAYFEELQQAVFSTNAGFRSDCEAMLNTALMKGYAAETWIGFVSNDALYASDSVYTGKVQL